MSEYTNQHCCDCAAGTLCCCNQCCSGDPGWGLCATICTGCICCPPISVYALTCLVGWCGTCCYFWHCGCAVGPEKVAKALAKAYTWCVMSCFPCIIPKDNFEQLDKFVYEQPDTFVYEQLDRSIDH